MGMELWGRAKAAGAAEASLIILNGLGLCWGRGAGGWIPPPPAPASGENPSPAQWSTFLSALPHGAIPLRYVFQLLGQTQLIPGGITIAAWLLLHLPAPHLRSGPTSLLFRSVRKPRASSVPSSSSRRAFQGESTLYLH